MRRAACEQLIMAMLNHSNGDVNPTTFGGLLMRVAPSTMEEWEHGTALLASLLDHSSDDTSRPLSWPEPRLVKTAAAAEGYAAEVMRAMGYHDAAVAGPGADGGIDVTSSAGVAQVKMEGITTGRPVVQAIAGIAAIENKEALLFSLAGFTAQAIEWADRAGVACFEYELDGSIEPKSAKAEARMRNAPAHTNG